MLKRWIFYILMLMTAAYLSAQGDSTAGQRGVVYLHGRDLCSGYSIDVRIIDNPAVLQEIVDSLKGVQPNAYPLVSQWCNRQSRRIRRYRSSLLDDYKWDDDKLWFDSTHCLLEVGGFVTLLAQRIDTLNVLSAYYERAEEERVENEKREMERRERLERERILREREALLSFLKDTIRELHQEISFVCDGKTITDKNRQKELKDYYYAYLSIYNRYDISSSSTEESRLNQLSDLQLFQREYLDSILGNNSYVAQINDFGNRFKLRCGKTHGDVSRSYNKISKRVQVPINFKTIAEYRQYVDNLKDIMILQWCYVEVVNYRDTIATFSNALLNKCSKKHKEIYNAYQQVEGEFNLVPDFTTVNDGYRFIDALKEINLVQKEYSSVVDRMLRIERCGDTITKRCGRGLSDVSAAYKKMVEKALFVPDFKNLSGATSFNQKLDDFEELQNLYLRVIDIRHIIDSKEDSITRQHLAPKGLLSGYKQMGSHTTLTPDFATLSNGYRYIDQLEHFVDIQNQFLQILDNHGLIEANHKLYRSAFRDYQNISKAYDRVVKSYAYDLNILSEGDISAYLNHQNRILSMQQRFGWLLQSNEKADYNNRMRKEKNVDNIKLIMRISDD